MAEEREISRCLTRTPSVHGSSVWTGILEAERCAEYYERLRHEVEVAKGWLNLQYFHHGFRQSSCRQRR